MTNEIFKKEKVIDGAFRIIHDAQEKINELHNEADKQGWDDIAAALDEYSARLGDIRHHILSHEVVEAAGDLRVAMDHIRDQ